MKSDKPTGLLAVNVDVAELLIDALCSDTPCTDRWTRPVSDLAMATFSHKILPVGMPLVAVVATTLWGETGAAAAEILVGRLNNTLPAEPQRLHLPMEILPVNTGAGGAIAPVSGVKRRAMPKPRS